MAVYNVLPQVECSGAAAEKQPKTRKCTRSQVLKSLHTISNGGLRRSAERLNVGATPLKSGQSPVNRS
ncbi:MAG: hypothetical protein FWD13_04630 [Treponema sp.]|nr:hypothetical protein [Treponema sp.]